MQDLREAARPLVLAAVLTDVIMTMCMIMMIIIIVIAILKLTLNPKL